MKDIWVEKYRPKTVDEYVFKDEAQKHQVKSWVADGGIPHLLFSGSPGTGKTTLAKVLINDLSVQEADVLLIEDVGDKSLDVSVFKPEIDKAEKSLSKFFSSVDVVN